MFLPLIKEIDKKKALSGNLRKLGLERTGTFTFHVI